MKHILLTIAVMAVAHSSITSQVVINEVIPPNTVEFKNIGPNAVSINGYWLCNNGIYDQVDAAMCGNLNIPAGQIAAFTTSINISAGDGELGLYLAFDFDDPNDVVDYVQWGSGPHLRTGTAVAAGEWPSTGVFAPAITGCSSLEFDGTGNTPDDWMTQDVATSPCMENSLDGCGGGPACDLTSAGLNNVDCDNNGTGTNPNDDIITFTLNPQGTGLATTYDVSVNQGSVNPTSAAYGGPISFSLQSGSAGDGNVVVTVTDNDDGACTVQATIIDPGTCSDDCDLITTGLANVACNDNGTDSDPGDDIITFTLNPAGLNTGATYDVSVSSGSVNPTSAAYGGSTAFSLQAGSAGGGNVTVTVTDAGDPGCDVSSNIIDPGACSDACVMEATGLANVACDDNGTGSDPEDDIITFTLNPIGTNTSATYDVIVSSGSVNPSIAPYGVTTAFSLQAGSAGGGTVTVTTADSNDPLCEALSSIIDPGTCSNACTIEAVGLSNVTCDDNGTEANATDDRITFTLNPSGVNLGATYSVTVSQGNVMPTSGAYGGATMFTMQTGSAGGGDVTVTVTDGDSPGCTMNAVVDDPGSCSDACDITSVNLDNVACSNNGTDMDATDDVITFTLNPVGVNLGAMYNVTVGIGSVNPTSAAYGSATMFALNAGSAGGGNVLVGIADASDPACSEEVTVMDPGVCSEECNVDGGSISTDDETTVCAGDGQPDNITPVLTGGMGEEMDWVITDADGIILSLPGDPPFNFDGAGNGTSLIWNVSYDAGLMGLSAGNDIDDLTGCYELSNSIEVTHVQPNGGMIMTGDPTQVCTDDGEADTIEVSLTGNIGSNSAWVISNQAGVILDLPAGPPFSFEGAGAGICRIWHLSYEDGLTGLEVDANLSDLMGCYDLSNVITIVKQTGLDCDPCEADGGTISTMDSTSVCVGDGAPDPVDAEVTGNTGPNNTWIISDEMGVILALPASLPYNFEGQDPGICRIWHISYEPGLQGLALNEEIGNLMGCFDLSNAIDVMKLQPEGGAISTMDTTTHCVDDGAPDPVNVVRMGASGGNMAWVITDALGMILSLPAAPPFDFEGSDAGVCVVWSVSYEDGLTGLDIGNNVAGLMGCYDFSDSIRVTKLAGPDCGEVCDADGGTITTESDTTICVGDDVTDTVDVVVSGISGEFSAFVSTNESGMIVDVNSDGSFTFETLGAGTCSVYHISYNAPLAGLDVGENLADLDGCFALSNAISVVRVTAGDECVSATLDPRLQRAINVYPNPASGSFQVFSDGPEIERIEVFDATGRKHLEVLSRARQEEIDPGVVSGLFYLRIHTDLGVAVKKVVVMRD